MSEPLTRTILLRLPEDRFQQLWALASETGGTPGRVAKRLLLKELEEMRQQQAGCHQ